MKTAFGLAGLAVLVVALPTVVVAAPALRSIMRVWRADARTAHDILFGKASFDAAAIRGLLQTYVRDADGIATQINGRTAAAAEFRRQLAAFRTDAQTALADLAQRGALQADMSRVMSDCQSCHNKFNN